jgi:F-type H+-transporting ATPase subunit a
MEETGTAIQTYLPYVSVFNLALTSVLLALGGWILTRKPFTEDVPEDRQNIAEATLSFFVDKAREMGDGRVVRVVAPFLATCFLLILVSNLFGFLPIPLLNTPPAAFFSVPLGLALCAVGGTLVLSGVFNGLSRAVKHLFWPNPLQLVSEVTDVLSLSLRLFGNIGGEHMTFVLVSSAVAVGIPLILHVLGLIPVFVQALVFTLLTASFLAGAISHVREREQADAERGSPMPRTPGGSGPSAPSAA